MARAFDGAQEVRRWVAPSGGRGFDTLVLTRDAVGGLQLWRRREGVARFEPVRALPVDGSHATRVRYVTRPTVEQAAHFAEVNGYEPVGEHGKPKLRELSHRAYEVLVDGALVGQVRARVEGYSGIRGGNGRPLGRYTYWDARREGQRDPVARGCSTRRDAVAALLKAVG